MNSRPDPAPMPYNFPETMPKLDWLTRPEDERAAASVPYRLLEAVPELSYGDEQTENMLIQGDNLEALKALLPFYAGRVKCIYIDPPYNTRSAFFEDYDDNLKHSQWLAMMYPRLHLLWELLTPEDGVIVISINDDESHYLKVICDEIFGRSNFIASLVWNYEGNTDNQAKIINYHEYILIYSKSGSIPYLSVVDPNVGEASKLKKPEIRNTIIKNGPKNPPKTVVIPAGFPCSFTDGAISKSAVRWPQYSKDIHVKEFRTENATEAKTGWSSRDILEEFIANNFKSVRDSKGQETTFELTRTGAIEAIKRRSHEKGHFVSVLRGFGTTNQMRLMLEKLGLTFTFPKPVNLISYLVDAFTNENSIVLDSFAGSGTTAHAVLNLNLGQNTKRKFILIEISQDTATSVIIPRIKAVIDGSEVAEIQATGGGFRFYRLGSPIFDEQGHIHPSIRFDHLAAHIWFAETHTPLIAKRKRSPLLGNHNETAYYLLYNGILGDKRPDGGNVLTRKTLSELPAHNGPKVIYGESSRLSAATLKQLGIVFKQPPYDVKAR